MSAQIIKYAIGMDTMMVKPINAVKYEQKCRELKTNCFEMIPDDIPVKLYFDVDIKNTVENGPDLMQESDRLLQGVVDYLNAKFENAELAIGTSNSPSFIPYKQSEAISKLSFRIVINNYTALKRHQKLIAEQLNRDSSQIMDGEDLEMHYPNGVFDLQPYNNGYQKIRSLYASKPTEDRPMKLHSGTFEQMCITAFIPENAEVIIMPEPEKRESTLSTPSTTDSNVYRNIFIDSLKAGLLTNYSKGEYGIWFKFGCIIKNVFDDESLFHEFSKLDEDRYHKDTVSSQWEKIERRTFGGIGWGSFIRYIKESNYSKAMEIIKNSNATLQKSEEESESESVSNSRFAEDDISAARIILSDLSGNIVYSNNRIFIKKNNIWVSDNSDVQNFLHYFILDSDIRKMNSKGEFIPYAQNSNAASLILKALNGMIRETSTADELFYGKLHSTTKGRLCFKNGVYDFKTAQFYSWDKIPFEYYSTQMIPLEYTNAIDRTVMNTIQQSIFEPLFGDKMQEALQFLSRAIAGHCEDKNWASYLGNRDCGKGVIYDLLKLSLGSYVQTFELNHIMYQRDRPDTSEATRKLYWLMDFEFTRLAISQETPDRKSQLKVNSKLLKKLAGGGDTHVARRNYDRQDTHFLIDTTFMIMGNEAIQVDSEDAFEHCLQWSSSFQFKTEEEIENRKQLYSNTPQLWNKYRAKDPNLKDKCRSMEWQLATIQLLIENYTSNALSVHIQEDSFDTNEIPLEAMIANLYEFTGSDSDFIPVDQVVASLDQSKKKVLTEMKGLGIEKRKSKTKQHRDMICFYGIREKVSINNPDESIS